MSRRYWLGPLLLVVCAGLARSAEGEKALPTLRPSGIEGSLLLCGGGKIPEAATRRFVTLAGGDKGHLVVIPTASELADKDPLEKWIAPWKEFSFASVKVLHTRSRKQADDPTFVAPLKTATAVWIEGGSPSRLAEVYLGTAVEKELAHVLERGGVIGGTSAGAAIQARTMLATALQEPKLAPGFDLLPGTIIDEHPGQRQSRLLAALKQKPGLVGVGIDEGTALLVRGRTMQVLGEGAVTVCLAPGAGKPERIERLKPRELSDLTMWRRAALARTQPAFPPKKGSIPEVPRGSLVIVGGGGAPAEIVKKFIALAGGPDALIVVLPTALGRPLPLRVGEVTMLERAGAKNVHLLPGFERQEIESQEALTLLRKAQGLWFTGGRQWRFVDSYADTRALPLFHQVLQRGGVIGGSSAGASIQAEYMVRGSPLVNTEMMCEGYERGLGFLPGVAVDQHFSQRKRFGDMTALIKTYPQLLGIGIDEATALVVHGHIAEVLGRNKVQFYDAKRRKESPDYEVVYPGGKYDLKARRILAEGKK